MKYGEKEFNSAVQHYKKLAKRAKGRNFFIIFDISNKEAFYSIAPLSRAMHETGADVNCIGINDKSEGLEALKDVWKAFEQLQKGIKNEKTNALKSFIDEVDRKAKGRFKQLFKKPDFILEASKSEFNGTISLPFHTEWFRDYRMNELMQTAKILWRDVYDLKKGERVGIGFTLIPTHALIGHPLEDYLDSYSIIWAMTQVARQTA